MLYLILKIIYMVGLVTILFAAIFTGAKIQQELSKEIEKSPQYANVYAALKPLVPYFTILIAATWPLVLMLGLYGQVFYGKTK